MVYLIGYLIVACIMGIVSKKINDSRDGWGWGSFWWGFLMGPLGIVVVAVRPKD